MTDAQLVSHITEAKIKSLYQKLYRQDYSIVKQAETVAAKVDDQLAVYELLILALTNVIRELEDYGHQDEDGEDLGLYDGHPISYFKAKLAAAHTKIAELKTSGKTSSIFQTYMDNRNTRLKKEVDRDTDTDDGEIEEEETDE